MKYEKGKGGLVGDKMVQACQNVSSALEKLNKQLEILAKNKEFQKKTSRYILNFPQK